MILSLDDILGALAGLFLWQSGTLTSFRTFCLFHPPSLIWLRLAALRLCVEMFVLCLSAPLLPPLQYQNIKEHGA
jgi:hypothetical protein